MRKTRVHSYKRLLLSHLSPEELDAYINPAYRQKLRDEGIGQGIEQGKRAMYHTLVQVLTHRLGEMPAPVLSLSKGRTARLQSCTLDQLNALVNPVLDVATWDEFAALLPG